MSEETLPLTSDDLPSEPEGSESAPVNVIIIGAGIAGLAAAQRLLDSTNPDKINVTILEASSRVGGRIHSVPLGDGISEQGATWIHGIEGNPVYECIDDKSILSSCESSSYWRQERHYFYSDGETLPRDLVKKVGGLYTDAVTQSCEFTSSEKAKMECGKSVGQYLEKKFDQFAEEFSEAPKNVLADILRCFVNGGCCYNGCDSMYDLMLKDQGEYLELEGTQPIFTKGYSQITDNIFRKLPEGCVVFNSPVKCVHWKEPIDEEEEINTDCNGPLTTETVRVECEDGRVFPADYVIVTVSLGVLKENQQNMFNPQLPIEKQGAIERMGFGTVATISLEYDEPFWNAYNKHFIRLVWKDNPEYAVRKNPNQEWHKKLHTFYQSLHNSNVLVAWLAGSEAVQMESIPDEEVIQRCTEIFQNVFDNPLIPRPKTMLKTQWYTNPLFRGSYSYVAVGSQGADIDVLAKPVSSNGRPVVLFAGEATHRYYYSTTHGAMLSGQREAERIHKWI